MEDKHYFDEYAVASLKEVLENEFKVLMGAYRCDVIDKCNQIEGFYNIQDTENLLKSIHSLKGSSGNIGALVFSHLCAEFESVIHDKKASLINEKYKELLSEKEGLLQEIDVILKGYDQSTSD